MRLFFILFLLCLLSLNSWSQDENKIDSLQNAINKIELSFKSPFQCQYQFADVEHPHTQIPPPLR